jgi:endoglucanase
LGINEKTGTESGKTDDRWVFTQENAGHEYTAIQGLAAAARVLKGYNDDLAARCLKAATELYDVERQVSGRSSSGKINAACELLLATNDVKYQKDIYDMKEQVVRNLRANRRFCFKDF